MEKNKANILSRVSPEMKKVMDFEERQRKDRIRSGEENLTDREAYEASRSFFNEGDLSWRGWKRFLWTMKGDVFPVFCTIP